MRGITERKIAGPRTNNAVASGDEKVPGQRVSEEERERELRPEDRGYLREEVKKRANAEEELWERRENCKTTRRATAHAEGIIPRCGLKSRAIWPHANV